MAPWLITLSIILINGFFVAAEFALVKVRGSQLDVLIKQGNGKAKIIKMVTENLDNYLSACQLGITIASLALWWVSEPLIASQFVELNEFFQRGLSDTSIHAIAIPVTFFLITTLHIVVGEQAPKSFAIRDPLATSNRIILPLYYFYKIFKPLIWFLNILSLAFLRLLGLTQNHEEHSHSEEELRMIIAESEEDGQINADEMELIQNVFDFDNRQVSEIMTANHKIFAIARDNRDDQIIKKIVQEGFSRVPIYEGGIDNIIWWVLLKDITSNAIQGKPLNLERFLRPLQFVPENMKISDCLKLLQQSHNHVAVVSSEHGTTLGLITMEDILEELVGDIHDEGDEQQALVQSLGDGEFLVDATASISDANELLPIPLPEQESYDTVSGYINMLFGRIPSVNEKIEEGGYLITIHKRKKQRVDYITLKIIG